MHLLTEKRVVKFAKDFGFEGKLSNHFEKYVAATYLFRYIKDSREGIELAVVGGGDDEGIDIAAVIINGQVVYEPSDIDDLITGQGDNTAKVVFIQAKSSTSFDSKSIAKFLHGVELVTMYAMKPSQHSLPPRLVDTAKLIDQIALNGDKFRDTKIPCELYYVTTSNNDGSDAAAEQQVGLAMARIRSLDVYPPDLRLRTQGHEQLAAKQKEKLGPQRVQFNFEKRQTIPSADGVDEAYLGLIAARELMKLLVDNEEVRPGIFDDNVRLHLGLNNPVNMRIRDTLYSDARTLFPFLNNGLTIIATSLQGMGDKFFISGYQVVNGGQTSHQIIHWASNRTSVSQRSTDEVWVPIKVISSADPAVRSRVAVATNLQTPIGNADIQSSSKQAKNVEEYFAQSGAEGLRYERQVRGAAMDFVRIRIVGTPELNRAVAATIFGESSRAIGSPKELEVEDSFVWGDYPVEMYYFAAWVLYRIDRYFARTPGEAVLKAAKYHMAMMVSCMSIPELTRNYGAINGPQSTTFLNRRSSMFRGIDKSGDLQDKIEGAIPIAAMLVREAFATALSEGRSLRKDDVRSLKWQEELLERARKRSK